MSGKGSGRRKGANDAKYSEGWDRIFGKRNSSSPKGDSSKERTKNSTGAKRSSS